MIFIVIVLVGLGVAYANGANDNFKGVATLFGSGTTTYRRALAWATGTTMLGSVTALFLADNLIKSFGGKGLVENAIAIEPAFAASVGMGAGMTILIATRIGMPVSTTHGLIGALVGTGWIAGSTLDFSNLGNKFLIPLLCSPVIAVVVTGIFYPVLRKVRTSLGITRDICICIGEETIERMPSSSHTIALERAAVLTASMGKTAICETRYEGRVLGFSIANVLDRAHFLSSGMVGFARGLNDTPKIAALLLLAPAIGIKSGLAIVGIMIAIGGILGARRVAETMSKRITTMNHGQGLTANFVTGLIVIGASWVALPVSTTHVSCGSLFGIGAVTGGARRKTIITILMAWIVTLPMAAIFASLTYLVLKRV